MKIELGKTIARVVWEDAWADSDHHTLASIDREGPYLMETHGIIIRNNKSGVSLAVTKTPYNFRQIHHIPRAMIRKVEILRA